ncbi:MAG: glycosyltransferase family 9 protein, partial [Chloroflexota bacterium]
DQAVVWLRRPDTVAANLARLGARAILSAPPLPDPGSGTHAADWLLDTLRSIGVTAPVDWDAVPWLCVRGDARQWAASWIAKHVGAGPFAVLHPGSGRARKNWPAAAWARVIDALQRRRSLSLVLIAGPADDEALRSFREARAAGPGYEPGAGPDVVLAGAALPHLAAVLERAALYLGNDSGVTHLAAGLGVPTVAVFGPTDPAIWRPRGPRVRMLGGTPPLTGSGSRLTAGWPDEGAVMGAAEELGEET